jgi:hypothetical protein
MKRQSSYHQTIVDSNTRNALDKAYYTTGVKDCRQVGPSAFILREILLRNTNKMLILPFLGLINNAIHVLYSAILAVYSAILAVYSAILAVYSAILAV